MKRLALDLTATDVEDVAEVIQEAVEDGVSEAEVSEAVERGLSRVDLGQVENNDY